MLSRIHPKNISDKGTRVIVFLQHIYGVFVQGFYGYKGYHILFRWKDKHGVITRYLARWEAQIFLRMAPPLRVCNQI